MQSVRRIVTKQNAEGEAVLFSSDQAGFEKWPGVDAGSVVVWSTGRVPADNSDGDLGGATRRIGMTLPGGSVFRVTELGPGFRTPMHRTLSADYCLVLSGTLELILDGGKKVTLQTGDAVVQRGTNHAWGNPARETPCRFMVCMIEAEMVSTAGAKLYPTPIWKLILSSLPALFVPRLPRRIAPEFGASVERARTEGWRRVVTTHDPAGKAELLSDEQIHCSPSTDGGVAEVLIWSTDRVPGNNTNGGARLNPDECRFRGGSRFRVIQLEPGFETAVHHTQSIDYCLVLSGELELILDGETVRLFPGETVVQRGTAHAWRNPNNHTSCRFVMCTIEATGLRRDTERTEDRNFTARSQRSQRTDF
jgi:quercetin dioxygenase-like cupin family protein